MKREGGQALAKNILVVADMRGNEVRHVTFETIGAARQVASGGKVSVLIAGHGVAAEAERLAAAGSDEVVIVDDPELAQRRSESLAACVESAVRDTDAQIVALAHSAVGRDVAPMIAARFSAPQVSDIVALALEDDRLVCRRPVYAGKAFVRVVLEGDFFVLTVRPNNLPKPDAGQMGRGLTRTLAVELPTARLVLREVLQKTSSGVDLTEAGIVVAGGRGVKSADGFKPLYELAAALGGAVGASRGACDAGYCDYALQIGQTGKVVTPDLYIACGISGAIQHLAGMSNAKVIVAINKDPEAPIFRVADYGIVGDLFEVVPALTAQVKALA